MRSGGCENSWPQARRSLHHGAASLAGDSSAGGAGRFWRAAGRALEALTGVLAAELGKDNIRVSCVRPGAVLTEINVRAGVTTADEQCERRDGMGSMHALGRIDTVQEIAEAFEYLVRADWSTGNVLTVDGGLGLGVTND